MKLKDLLLITTIIIMGSACATNNIKTTQNKNINFPNKITIKNIAQNPEGIEYDKNDNTFLLSSLNAMPILKINLDGTYKAFTSGEKFALSTAGIQIDYKRNRLLVASFNGAEAMDKDPKTKGASFLRIYNLKTGLFQKEISLSHLAPDASAYFANDIAIDKDGNAYITDWYARVIYKVTVNGKATLFWKNKTGIKSGPNGIDFNKNGYLLVSILNVNKKMLYADYGLVKIPVSNSKLAKLVNIDSSKYRGFDGMVIKPNGNIIGVTNNGKKPGGNILLELSSNDNWKSAKVINSKDIASSTTVAVMPKNKNYVINQDFANNFKKTWKIEQIKF
jgi:sugar lactone lactonase YvrE